MLKLDHLMNFDPLESFLAKRKIPFLAYQASEYLLRKAMNDYSSITNFPGQDFNAGFHQEEILKYMVRFKQEHGQDWGKQPFIPSGVADEKLKAVHDLERALKIIEGELAPFAARSAVVKEVQDKVCSTVEKMRKKLTKDLEELKQHYEKADFWDQQQELYLAASKIFAEKMFGDQFADVNKFIVIKHELYFANHDKKSGTLIQQINRFLHDQDLQNYLDKYFEKHRCKKIVEAFFKEEFKRRAA